MNLRDLRYLVAVADQRHFGKAAESCHVSQPTLSVQIRKLEEQLGISCFERNGRKLLITPAGEAVIAEARQALAHADAIIDIAHGFRDPLSGPFRLGVIATLGPSIIGKLLDRLDLDAPRLQVTLREDLTDNLVPAVLSGELDAAIIATEEAPGELEEQRLFLEPFLIGYAPNHPLCKQAIITVNDLSQGPLLLLSEGNCLRDQTLSLCDLDRSRDHPAPVLASSLETAFEVAATGRGITLVPALSASRASPLALRDLPPADDGLPPGRIVRLVKRRRYGRKQVMDIVASSLQQIAQDEGMPLQTP
ncbi:MAG: LysR substrate-binding domain-containing protein [Alphaproteobacteria bacterium]